MAYTALITQAIGDYWTAANHNQYVKDNFAASLPAIAAVNGRIWAGTGADAANEIVPGSDGQVLIADSTQATGVNWGYPSWKLLSLKKSADQALTPGDAITWETEVRDDDSAHTGSSSDITIQASGWYFVNMHAEVTCTYRASVDMYIDGAVVTGRGLSFPSGARLFPYEFTASQVVSFRASDRYSPLHAISFTVHQDYTYLQMLYLGS